MKDSAAGAQTLATIMLYFSHCVFDYSAQSPDWGATDGLPGGVHGK